MIFAEIDVADLIYQSETCFNDKKGLPLAQGYGIHCSCWDHYVWGHGILLAFSKYFFKGEEPVL